MAFNMDLVNEPKRFFKENGLADHNRYDGDENLYIKTRMELVKAMKEAPSCPKEFECQYVPSMEIFGIMVSHLTITKMLLKGQLTADVAQFVNSILSTHSFLPLHASTHEAISQHNEEHFAFESTVARWAGLFNMFDDSYKEFHARHHNNTGAPIDADLQTQLPLNKFCQGMAMQHEFPIEFKTGIPGKNWEKHYTQHLLREDLIKLLTFNNETENVGATLQKTWMGAIGPSQLLLTLFFGRYPHKNGTNSHNEFNSYYETSFRGEKMVDLCMMGEGWHVGHHAKPDVLYTHLGKVGQEVEAKHSNIRKKLRSVSGYEDNYERGVNNSNLPEIMGEADDVSLLAWNRTVKTTSDIDTLFQGNINDAFVGFSETAINSALYVSTNCDFGYLRHLHKEGGYQSDEMKAMYAQIHKQKGEKMMQEGDRLKWHETIWSDKNQEEIKKHSDLIRNEVKKNALHVANKFISLGLNVKNHAELKEKLSEMYITVLRTFISDDMILKGIDAMLAYYKFDPNGKRKYTLKSHFEDRLPMKFAVETGKKSDCQHRISCVLYDIQAYLQGTNTNTVARL